MGKLDGRTAIITGAARGQGRAHALTLAREGAAIVACDIADQIDGVPYAMATKPDLEETARLVRAEGGTCLTERVDVRSRDAFAAVVERARAELGTVDILVNAAAIVHWKPFEELTESDWHDVIEVNLHGSVNTIHSVLPAMVEQRRGRIICTGSTLGRTGGRNLASYSASKWALHGLVKCIAIEYATFGITANIINPTIVNTPMMDNENAYKLFCPDIEHPTREDALPRYQTLNQIPVPWVEPEVISRSVLFLASDDAEYITGAALDVAAGANALYTA
ncbi:MAG TPA: mycofactocin-coupled SDR family oxidoreductase [Gemmatirosa sp.]